MGSTKEECGVAFIRHKEVHGHKYYQAVRNYRDIDGKHHQQVLCHLGVHSSLEATIDSERTKVKVHRGCAVLRRMRAKFLRAKLLDLHGWEFVDSELPSEAEAAEEFWLWWDVGEAYYDPNNHYGRRHIDIEEVDIQVEKYRSCFEYYAAMGRASWADLRADAHQEKLDKLNRVRREYF
jgi:hypothetical protein